MKKQSQSASSERVKALVKFSATGILTLAMLASVTACNKPGQTTTPNKPNPPVVDPIEKTVTVNKIYADNFFGTSFDGDIQAAQIALANKVFENLNPQITNIKYNEDTKELEFSIAYTEDDKTKSGSMTFIAPQFFQDIRGRDAKSIVLERAQLVGTTEIKESNIDDTKATITTIVANIRKQISTAFESVKLNDIIVEKEQTPEPIETISFDEIIVEQLGEYLGNDNLLFNAAKKMFPMVIRGFEIEDNFKVSIENEKLIFYVNQSLEDQKRLTKNVYNGSANEFDDLINASTNAQNLLDKYFTTQEQNNLAIEVNGNLHKKIDTVCSTIVSNINEQVTKMESLTSRQFTRNELARHNNDLTDEQALQFALKLGYTADEVCGVYVTKPTGYGFDDEYFETGYMSGFTVSVFTKEQYVYKLDSCIVNVPHYTNSTTIDYYRYFLEGERGDKYITRNETSTSINGIIIDYAEEIKTAQSKYAKVTSIDNFDLYMPLNFN